MTAKKIIIIGASSGIGRIMAELFAQRGNLVAVTGRRAALLNELNNKYPNNIIASAFDVTADDSRYRMESLIQQLNGLDLLVYNAGYGAPSSELLWEDERITVKTNVKGFLAMANFAFNYFSQQGYGQIALTSSVAALRGNSWAPAYSASKAFMSNYAEGLNIKARKFKKEIIVTDIRPGFIATKEAKGNKQFWIANPQKAAVQMVKAIEEKRRVAYISRRWRLVAQIMRWLPFSLYRRIA